MPTRRDEGSRVRAGEHAVSTQHAGAHMFVVTVVVVRVTFGLIGAARRPAARLAPHAHRAVLLAMSAPAV